MTEKIEIREVTPSDIGEILKTMNDIFREQQYFALERDRNYWNSKYEKNVFGKPILLVAEAQGKIAGFRAFWPWEFTCRGQIVKAYQTVDTVLQPSHQSIDQFVKIIVLGNLLVLEGDCAVQYAKSQSCSGMGMGNDIVKGICHL